MLAALCAVGMLGLTALPASAQATRTWVSGVGDDANPCSRTAPCKTFPGAISKTATGGEINCLDPGGFGGVTITKAITIRCDYTQGGVLVSGTNAIVVSAPDTARVILRGLDINGLTVPSNGTSLTGVKVLQAKSVKIYNSARSSPTPALNALATIMLALSLLMVVAGFVLYRRMTRGERQQKAALGEFFEKHHYQPARKGSADFALRPDRMDRARSLGLVDPPPGEAPQKP